MNLTVISLAKYVCSKIILGNQREIKFLSLQSPIITSSLQLYYLQFPTITSSLQLLPPISKNIACFLAPTSLLQECSDESKGVLYLSDTSFKKPSKKFKMAIDLSEHAMVDMCIVYKAF